MSLAMTRAERETFLAGTHIAVLGLAQPGRAPLVVPVWYDYVPGDAVRIVTGGASRKIGFLRQSGRASLCVQDETPPYRYVTVEGPVEIGPPDFERDVRRVAIRYLGEQAGEAYLRATAVEHEGAVLVTLRPERWLSVDYRKWSI
jgi:PPOX class probable F420-dependent enzyme